jgi:hypothetical protein
VATSLATKRASEPTIVQTFGAYVSRTVMAMMNNAELLAIANGE